MLLGYNTNGFAHHRLEDAIAILAELGYRSIALTLDYHALNPFDPDLPRQLAAVKSLLQERGLRSVVETGARFLLDPRRKHQPTLLSPPPDRDRRLDFLKRAVNVAAELGSDAVSFWSGAANDAASPEELLDRLADGCIQLCRHAETRGVRLAFEPEPGMFIDTMDRYAELRAARRSPPLRPHHRHRPSALPGRSPHCRPAAALARAAVERPHRGHAARRPRPPDVWRGGNRLRRGDGCAERDRLRRRRPRRVEPPQSRRGGNGPAGAGVPAPRAV